MSFNLRSISNVKFSAAMASKIVLNSAPISSRAVKQMGAKKKAAKVAQANKRWKAAQAVSRVATTAATTPKASSTSSTITKSSSQSKSVTQTPQEINEPPESEPRLSVESEGSSTDKTNELQQEQQQPNGGDGGDEGSDDDIAPPTPNSPDVPTPSMTPSASESSLAIKPSTSTRSLAQLQKAAQGSVSNLSVKSSGTSGGDNALKKTHSSLSISTRVSSKASLGLNDMYALGSPLSDIPPTPVMEPEEFSEQGEQVSLAESSSTPSTSSLPPPVASVPSRSASHASIVSSSSSSSSSFSKTSNGIKVTRSQSALLDPGPALPGTASHASLAPTLSVTTTSQATLGSASHHGSMSPPATSPTSSNVSAPSSRPLKQAKSRAAVAPMDRGGAKSFAQLRSSLKATSPRESRPRLGGAPPPVYRFGFIEAGSPLTDLATMHPLVLLIAQLSPELTAWGVLGLEVGMPIMLLLLPHFFSELLAKSVCLVKYKLARKTLEPFFGAVDYAFWIDSAGVPKGESPPRLIETVTTLRPALRARNITSMIATGIWTFILVFSAISVDLETETCSPPLHYLILGLVPAWGVSQLLKFRSPEVTMNYKAKSVSSRIHGGFDALMFGYWSFVGISALANGASCSSGSMQTLGTTVAWFLIITLAATFLTMVGLVAPLVLAAKARLAREAKEEAEEGGLAGGSGKGDNKSVDPRGALMSRSGRRGDTEAVDLEGWDEDSGPLKLARVASLESLQGGKDGSASGGGGEKRTKKVAVMDQGVNSQA